MVNVNSVDNLCRIGQHVDDSKILRETMADKYNTTHLQESQLQCGWDQRTMAVAIPSSSWL